VVLLGTACGYVAHECRIVAARKAWMATHDTSFAWYSHPNADSRIRRLLGDDEYDFIATFSAKDEDEAKQLFPEADVYSAAGYGPGDR
jgi:hypothetical protein